MTESNKDVNFCDAYNAQRDAEIEAMYMNHLPDWAIGHADGQYVLGAQLPTRDGRRMGNAHIVNIKEGCLGSGGSMYYDILTDAGTELVMTASELDECFYPPKWVSDVKEVIRKFKREE